MLRIFLPALQQKSNKLSVWLLEIHLEKVSVVKEETNRSSHAWRLRNSYHKQTHLVRGWFKSSYNHYL